MDTAYSRFDFEKLVRSSFKHGWLHKRSKGFKAVIPRKRYFVLCDDSLHWFKKEKNCFVQKGCLELSDMKIAESTSDALYIEKRSTGKVYILSGLEILEWSKTLAATLLPFSSCSKELKLSDYTISNGSESAVSKESGKFSRKSTECSSGVSSAVSSLPTSNASSCLDGESNPPTPQADLSDTSSLDENLIGKPILTKETLEKHNSTMDSIQLNDLTYRVDITHAATPPEDGLEAPNQNVKDAVSFFETLSNSGSDEPKSKPGRMRQRLFSKFGPETRNRLRTTPGNSSPKSIGGCSIPCSDISFQLDESSEGNIRYISETSLLSEEIADLNLEGTQTLDELADSLANLVDIFGTMNETIESQTQTNLFLFERGRSLLPPNESNPKKRLVSVTSEPTLLRIPSDQEIELSSRKNSSYRLSVDYRARGSTSYTMPSYTIEKSVPSLISLQTAHEDSFSSIPDVEDVDFETDERFADIEEYIHSKLICHEPISMIDLTNCFKGKRLPKQAFRKLYEKIRKQVEINRRVSRRQPEKLSQLSLVSREDSYFQGSVHEFCNNMRRQFRLSNTIYDSESELFITE